MTIQKIIPKSEDSLLPAAKVVDITAPIIQKVAADLCDSLANQQEELDAKYPKMGGGVGLASNQIEYPVEGGYPEDFKIPHMYVISVRPPRAAIEDCEVVEPTVFINANYQPVLEAGCNAMDEACLSVVGIKGIKVPRYNEILLTAYTLDGQRIEKTVSGYEAKIHQHEIEHCQGSEYLNQMKFSKSELEQILRWLDKTDFSKLEVPCWIIENKLQCYENNIDGILALRLWVTKALAERKKKLVINMSGLYVSAGAGGINDEQPSATGPK